MAGEAEPPVDPAAVLEEVTFDVQPSAGFDGTLAPLPGSARLGITLVPERGIGPTVERAEYAADRGYHAVPHLAPRFIADREELVGIVERLLDAGVTEIFVPGGDRDEPVGEFSSAFEMLVALEELGFEFEEVGIGGYPTGHAFLSEETIAEAIARKAPYATYITTQLCLSPEAILEWTRETRDRGVDLPVEVGIPGVVDYRRLFAMARKWGAVRPLEFLWRTTGVFGFLRAVVASGGRYEPDDLVAELALHFDEPAYGCRRGRLDTVKQTRDTEAWRRRKLGG